MSACDQNEDVWIRVATSVAGIVSDELILIRCVGRGSLPATRSARWLPHCWCVQLSCRVMSGWDSHHLSWMLGLAVRMWWMVLKRGWLFLIPTLDSVVMLLMVVTALRQSDQMVAELCSVLCRRWRADAIASSSIW